METANPDAGRKRNRAISLAIILVVSVAVAIVGGISLALTGGNWIGGPRFWLGRAGVLVLG